MRRGGAALAPSGYKLVFNAHQAAIVKGQKGYDAKTMNQDIGFSAVGKDLKPGAVVWLTKTAGNEADAAIARFEPSGAPEQYLVGWAEAAKPQLYKLALLDQNGAFLANPIDVTALVQWGRRDDPFREHYDGDVIWSWFDQAGSRTLHVARVDSGASYACK